MLAFKGYEDIKPVYRRSHATAFSAVHIQSKQTVLLKHLTTFPKSNWDQIEKLYDRIRQISSNRVAGVFDLLKTGTGPNETPVFVYEHFPGVRLKEYITSEKIPLEKALHLGVQLSEALADLHLGGVIHKGLTPYSITRHPLDQTFKITDFEFFSSLQQTDTKKNHPEIPSVVFPYISPEMTGRTGHNIDYRTDFYSLGVILYECLTGRLPFIGSDPLKLVHAHLAVDPDAPSTVDNDIPQVVSNIILRLLAKVPDERYQSAWGIKADLQQCIKELQSGSLSPFTLADKDISHILKIPEKLYGREEQISSLVNNLGENSQENAQMVLVSGRAGIGKSALVTGIQKPVMSKNGYFISGKFDQMNRGVPYAPFIHAFDRLIGQILSESKERITALRDKLIENLEPNGQVMVEVIPDLELIIGKQPEVPLLGSEEARNRFNYVFINFIRTFADVKHPLVIFLDDLQWSDSSSLNLIELFMSMEMKHLFILGAFRDNEIVADHPLNVMIEKLHENRSDVKIIKLGPLDEIHVSQLISDTLVCSTESARDLAMLCMEKTRGNPFFLHQFINALYSAKLIGFDPENKQWRWDTEKIRLAETTDNVVDFIIEKMGKLSGRTRNVLKIAACIGNRFDINTLAIAHEHGLSETLEELQGALEENLVSQDFDMLPETGVSFRFLHDRVQQAAYSLISKEHRPAEHLNIGRLMLEKIPEADREVRLFDIVNQLNLGIDLMSDANERERLAQLNLAAARKAKKSAAFEPAYDYLSTGLKLLAPDCWEEQYQMTLDLHVEAAEAAYLNGHFDRTDHLAQIVVDKACILLDTVNVYEIRIRSYAMQNKLSESVDIGRHILKKLGVEFPNRPNTFHILAGVLKTKMLLLGKKPEDLLDLPAMTDPQAIAIMKILRPLGSSAYLSDPKLALLMIIVGFNHNIKYGHLPEAFCFDSYGLLLCLIGDIDTGYRYGRISLEVIERFHAEKNESQVLVTFNSFIRHWKEPIRNVLSPLLKAYRKGLETGDLEWAGYACLMYCINAYFCGRSLLKLESELKKYGRFMAGIKQDTTLQYNAIFHQTISNLMGENNNPIRLVGNYYDEEKMLSVHIEAKDESALFDRHYHKMVLSYLFGEYQEALENAVKAEKHLDVVLSQPETPLFHFYDSLIRLAVIDDAMPKEIRRHLRKVAKNQKKMKKWAQYAPENCLHKYHLVEAERNRILEKDQQAMDEFDRAIYLSAENKYIQEEALANELAARFYLSRGRKKIVRTYLKEARKFYFEWGAFAKVNHLETLHPEIFDSIVSTNSSQGDRLGGLGHVADLASLTKAVKAIAGEKNLGVLLNQLMSIVIENAGARKGYLILKRKGRFIIEAGISSNEKDMKGAGSGIEECNDISSGITHYVIRTSKDVILNDATLSGRFTSDPYILQNDIKSVLCMPITDHGRMTGLLYLENRQVRGAFTTERVNILRTVSEILASAWARIEAEETLLSHRAKLRSLSSQILLTEERERRRIAVDLHDRIGHALSDIMLRLGAFKQTLQSQKSISLIDEIGGVVEQCSKDTHSLTFDISPPILYDLGLEAALDWLAEQTRIKHNIDLRFVDDDRLKPLDESSRILLFQSARELVFNMVKHSEAVSGKLSVALKNEEVHIMIEDDGIGFNPDQSKYQQSNSSGFGLFSIKERLEQQGGIFSVESETGAGTRVLMILPIEGKTRLNEDQFIDEQGVYGY